MRKTPKVTIIIPVYNAAPFLEECILSAAAQVYAGEIELIIVDNESTDNSLDVACRTTELLEVEYKLFSEPNKWSYTWFEPTRAALKCMAPDSEYFMFLGADDIIEDFFVANCMKILTSSSRIKALQSPINSVGAPELGQISHSYKSLKEFKSLCLSTCPVTTPSVVWHRSVYEGGLMHTHPGDLHGAEDYWMYCNQADKGLFIYPAPKWLGYNYRWNEGQATWGMHRDFPDMDHKIQTYWRERWKK